MVDVPSAGFGAGVKKPPLLTAEPRLSDSTTNENSRFNRAAHAVFSNVLFSGMPSPHSHFTNNEFLIAVQIVARLNLVKQAIGLLIKSTTCES